MKKNTFSKIMAGLLSLIMILGVTGCYTALQTSLQDSASGEAAADAAPDYADPNSWLSYGGDGSKGVDIFVVYPTVTISMASADRPYVRYNSDVMRTAASGWLAGTEEVVSDAANIYMPLYRQLNAVELDNLTNETFASYTNGLPRDDIFAAFDYYLTNVNKGERPFILYGHSQGAQLVIELATTLLGSEKYNLHNKNHIATYAIGCSVTEGELAKNPNVQFSKTKDDLGVLVSWNSTAPSEIKSEAYKNFGTWKPGALVTNPLTWKSDGVTAPAAAFSGSIPTATGTMPVQGKADATADKTRGILAVTTVDESQFVSMSKKISKFHTCDIIFFQDSISQNIKDRIAAFGE